MNFSSTHQGTPQVNLDEREEGEVDSQSDGYGNQAQPSQQPAQNQTLPLAYFLNRGGYRGPPPPYSSAGRGGGRGKKVGQTSHQSRESLPSLNLDQEVTHSEIIEYVPDDGSYQHMPNVIVNESDLDQEDTLNIEGQDGGRGHHNEQMDYNQINNEEFKEPVQPAQLFGLKGAFNSSTRQHQQQFQISQQVQQQQQQQVQYFDLDERTGVQSEHRQRRNSFSSIRQFNMSHNQHQLSTYSQSLNDSGLVNRNQGINFNFNNQASMIGGQQNQNMIQQQQFNQQSNDNYQQQQLSEQILQQQQQQLPYYRNNIIGQAVVDGQTVNRVYTDDLARLMRSKRDIYQILTIEGQYYLPPYVECTVMFLRDLFCGKKKCIKNEQVRIITVPRLNELSVTNLIKDVIVDPVLKLYLPDINQKRGMNRQFLFNIINTVKPSFFPENIKICLQQRKAQAAEKKQRFVELTSELYELVMNTNRLVSGSKKRKQPDRSNINQYELGISINAAPASKRFKAN